VGNGINDELSPAQERARRLIREAALRHGVNPDLLEATAYHESGLRSNATSPKGAAGIAQFMPGTAKRYGLSPEDRRDDVKAADAMARHFKDLLTKYDGDVESALIGYNAGEGTVDALRSGRRRGLPSETQKYLPEIRRQYDEIRKLQQPREERDPFADPRVGPSRAPGAPGPAAPVAPSPVERDPFADPSALRPAPPVAPRAIAPAPVAGVPVPPQKVYAPGEYQRDRLLAAEFPDQYPEFQPVGTAAPPTVPAPQQRRRVVRRPVRPVASGPQGMMGLAHRLEGRPEPPGAQGMVRLARRIEARPSRPDPRAMRPDFGDSAPPRPAGRVQAGPGSLFARQAEGIDTSPTPAGTPRSYPGVVEQSPDGSAINPLAAALVPGLYDPLGISETRRPFTPQAPVPRAPLPTLPVVGRLNRSGANPLGVNSRAYTAPTGFDAPRGTPTTRGSDSVVAPRSQPAPAPRKLIPQPGDVIAPPAVREALKSDADRVRDARDEYMFRTFDYGSKEEEWANRRAQLPEGSITGPPENYFGNPQNDESWSEYFSRIFSKGPTNVPVEMWKSYTAPAVDDETRAAMKRQQDVNWHNSKLGKASRLFNSIIMAANGGPGLVSGNDAMRKYYRENPDVLARHVQALGPDGENIVRGLINAPGAFGTGLTANYMDSTEPRVEPNKYAPLPGAVDFIERGANMIGTGPYTVAALSAAGPIAGAAGATGLGAEMLAGALGLGAQELLQDQPVGLPFRESLPERLARAKDAAVMGGVFPVVSRAVNPFLNPLVKVGEDAIGATRFGQRFVEPLALPSRVASAATMFGTGYPAAALTGQPMPDANEGLGNAIIGAFGGPEFNRFRGGAAHGAVAPPAEYRSPEPVPEGTPPVVFLAPDGRIGVYEAPDGTNRPSRWRLVDESTIGNVDVPPENVVEVPVEQFNELFPAVRNGRTVITREKARQAIEETRAAQREEATSGRAPEPEALADVGEASTPELESTPRPVDPSAEPASVEGDIAAAPEATATIPGFEPPEGRMGRIPQVDAPRSPDAAPLPDVPEPTARPRPQGNLRLTTAEGGGRVAEVTAPLSAADLKVIRNEAFMAPVQVDLVNPETGRRQTVMTGADDKFLDRKLDAAQRAVFGARPEAARAPEQAEAVPPTVLDRLDVAAEQARKNLASKLGRLSAGADPTMIADIAVIAAAKIARAGQKSAAWVGEIVREFGEDIRPHLRAIHDQAMQILARETAAEYEPLSTFNRGEAATGEGYEPLSTFNRGTVDKRTRADYFEGEPENAGYGEYAGEGPLKARRVADVSPLERAAELSPTPARATSEANKEATTDVQKQDLPVARDARGLADNGRESGTVRPRLPGTLDPQREWGDGERVTAADLTPAQQRVLDRTTNPALDAHVTDSAAVGEDGQAILLVSGTGHQEAIAQHDPEFSRPSRFKGVFTSEAPVVGKKYAGENGHVYVGVMKITKPFYHDNAHSYTDLRAIDPQATLLAAKLAGITDSSTPIPGETFYAALRAVERDKLGGTKDNAADEWAAIQAATKTLQKAGYDGAFYRFGAGDARDAGVWVAFEKGQFKHLDDPSLAPPESNVFFEVAPSKSVPQTEAWHKQDFAARQAATRRIVDKTLPDILKAAGIDPSFVDSIEHTIGGFMLETNPSVRIGLKATTDQVDRLARIIGLAYRQDSVLVTRLGDDAGPNATTDFVRLEFPKGHINGETADAFFQHAASVDEALGGGFAAKDDSLVFLNVRGEDGPYSNKSPDEFYDLVRRAAESYDGADHIEVGRPDELADVTFVDNDWKEHPNGESYRDPIEEGRPETAGDLRRITETVDAEHDQIAAEGKGRGEEGKRSEADDARNRKVEDLDPDESAAIANIRGRRAPAEPDRSTEQQTTRADLVEGFVRDAGVSRDEAESVATVVDAVAEAWGAVNDRPASDYYATRFAGTETGEGEANAQVRFLADGRALIRALGTKTNVTGLVHEVAHIFRRDLAGDLLTAAEDWAGVEDGNWTRAAEEKFARAFERYVRRGQAPTEGLRKVFSDLSTWFKEIYRSLKGSPLDVPITPELQRVFDTILSPEASRADSSAEARRALEARGGEARAGGETELNQLPVFARETKDLPELPADKVVGLPAKMGFKDRAKMPAKLDALRQQFPNVLRSAQEWRKFYAAMGAKVAPLVPLNALEYVRNPEKLVALLRTMQNSDGSWNEQVKRADAGFRAAKRWAAAYADGRLQPRHTAKIFLWGILSRKLSPFPHENAFVHASTKGIDRFIEDALEGNFDIEAYDAWSKDASPLAGTEGAGAQNNLNDYGKYFLAKMSERVTEGEYAGQTKLAVLHELMKDSSLSGREVRRQFHMLVDGAGIDNKVVSFALLATGRTDVLVLDRVQLNHLFAAERQFAQTSVWDGYDKEGNKKYITVNAYDGLPTGAVAKADEVFVPPHIQKLLDVVTEPSGPLVSADNTLKTKATDNAKLKTIAQRLEKEAAALKKANGGKDVPFDGPTAELDAIVRGEGTAAQKLEAIQKLADANRKRPSTLTDVARLKKAVDRENTRRADQVEALEVKHREAKKQADFHEREARAAEAKAEQLSKELTPEEVKERQAKRRDVIEKRNEMREQIRKLEQRAAVEADPEKRAAIDKNLKAAEAREKKLTQQARTLHAETNAAARAKGAADALARVKTERAAAAEQSKLAADYAARSDTRGTLNPDLTQIELRSTGLWEVGSSTRGLAVYEALEDALAAAGQAAYDAVGRGEDFSLARLHWETWVARSKQEVDHGSLPFILNEASGMADPYAGAAVEQGKYDTYKSGVRSVYLGEGRGTIFVARTSDGTALVLEGPAYDRWQAAVKKAGQSGEFVDKESPDGKFRVSKQSSKWIHDPANAEAYDRLLRQFGRGPTDRESVHIESPDGAGHTGELPDAGRVPADTGRVDAAGLTDLIRETAADLRTSGEASEAAAVSRLKGRSKDRATGRKAGSGVDLSEIAADIADLVQLGAARLKKTGAAFAEWSADFLDVISRHLDQDYADSLRPFLEEIYNRAKGGGESPLDFPNLKARAEATKNPVPVETPKTWPAKRGRIAKALRKAGANGDRLENALDLADDLTAAGGTVSQSGIARLYHRTTPEAKRAIVETGRMSGKEDQVYFSTKPDGMISEYGSDVVEVDVPLTDLKLEDVFDGEAHVTLRTGAPGESVRVRTAPEPGTPSAEARKANVAADRSAAAKAERARRKSTPEGDKLIAIMPDMTPQQKLQAIEDNARARAKAKLGRLSAGVDPTLIGDLVTAGAAKLARKALDFAEFSKAMIADFGDDVSPYLKKAYDGARASLKKRAIDGGRQFEIDAATDEILDIVRARDDGRGLSYFDAARRLEQEIGSKIMFPEVYNRASDLIFDAYGKRANDPKLRTELAAAIREGLELRGAAKKSRDEKAAVLEREREAREAEQPAAVLKQTQPDRFPFPKNRGLRGEATPDVAVPKRPDITPPPAGAAPGTRVVHNGHTLWKGKFGLTKDSYAVFEDGVLRSNWRKTPEGAVADYERGNAEAAENAKIETKIAKSVAAIKSGEYSQTELANALGTGANHVTRGAIGGVLQRLGLRSTDIKTVLDKTGYGVNAAGQTTWVPRKTIEYARERGFIGDKAGTPAPPAEAPKPPRPVSDFVVVENGEQKLDPAYQAVIDAANRGVDPKSPEFQRLIGAWNKVLDAKRGLSPGTTAREVPVSKPGAPTPEQALKAADTKAPKPAEVTPAGKTPQEKLKDFETKTLEKVKTKLRLVAKGEQQNAFLPADILADLIAVGAAKIARHGYDFIEFTHAMIDEFGDRVRPDLREIYDRARLKQKELEAQGVYERDPEPNWREEGEKHWNPRTSGLPDEYRNEFNRRIMENRPEGGYPAETREPLEVVREAARIVGPELVEHLGTWTKGDAIPTIAVVLQAKNYAESLSRQADDLYQRAEVGVDYDGDPLPQADRDAMNVRAAELEAASIAVIQSVIPIKTEIGRALSALRIKVNSGMSAEKGIQMARRIAKRSGHNLESKQWQQTEEVIGKLAGADGRAAQKANALETVLRAAGIDPKRLVRADGEPVTTAEAIKVLRDIYGQKAAEKQKRTIKPLHEEARDRAKARAEAAWQRIQEKRARLAKGQLLSSGPGVTLEMAGDIADLVASWLLEKGIDRAAIASRLVKEFGEGIKPHIDRIRAHAFRINSDTRRAIRRERDIERLTEGQPERYTENEIEDMLVELEAERQADRERVRDLRRVTPDEADTRTHTNTIGELPIGPSGAGHKARASRGTYKAKLAAAAEVASRRLEGDEKYQHSAEALDDIAAVGAAKLTDPDMSTKRWHREMSDEFGEAYLSRMADIVAASGHYFHAAREADTARQTERAATAGRQLSAEEAAKAVREYQAAKKEQQKTRAELYRAMAKIQEQTILEQFLLARKAGILTGAKTTMRNIMGTAGFAMVQEEVARVPAALIDLTISAFKGGRRTVEGANPLAMARAMREMSTTGLAEAIKIMKGEPTKEMMDRLEISRGLQSKSKILNLYVNSVFNFMSAQDRMMKVYIITRALEGAARIQAGNEKRAGVVTYGPGGKPMTVSERTRDIVSNPPEHLMADAIAEADYSTFNSDNFVAEGYQAMKTKFRSGGLAGVGAAAAMDMTMPFVRTPTNILARILDYSPVGGAYTIADMANQIRKEHKEGIHEDIFTPARQEQFARGIGRASVGTALIALGAAMFTRGLLSGTRDDDAGKRDRDQTTGRIPMAVKIGGMWHSIGALSPFGNLLALGATLQREHDQVRRDPGRMWEKLFSGAAGTVLEQPMLKGTKDILEAVNRPATSGGRFTAGTVASVVPTFVSDISDAMDWAQRDAPDVESAVMYRTPARQLLDQSYDLFGRPKEHSRLNAINPFISRTARAESDPADAILEELDIGLSRPKPWINEPDTQFRSRYIEIGRERYEEVKAELADPTFAPLPPADKIEVIEKALRRGKKTVDDRYRMMMPEAPEE